MSLCHDRIVAKRPETDCVSVDSRKVPRTLAKPPGDCVWVGGVGWGGVGWVGVGWDRGSSEVIE